MAFAIGASDETMSPAVGAGLLTLGVAVVIGGICNFIGAFFLGESVSKTVGQNLSYNPLTIEMVFIILIVMAIWLLIVSSKGVPISTTQSVVGNVIGIVIIEWGLSAVNRETLFWIVLSWLISPILGLIGGYITYWTITKIRMRVKKKGYDDYEKQEKIAAYLLALFLLITIFSRSGNDVAKAVGPLMSIPEFATNPIPILFAGGLGMCLGVIFLGRRVIEKLSFDIVALSPTSALAASISVSFIMFFGTLLGIPLSGSHILVTAFIGVGYVSKEPVNMDSMKEIGWSWILTLPVSASLSAIIFLLFKYIQLIAS
ncbi:MAG: inorganic phosphate transporter [Candidatus Hermodarchaeota archaeon]